MFEPALYKAEYKYSGIHQYINFPMPQPLYNRTSKMYPTYNMAIPDQFRIDQFIKEFSNREDGEIIVRIELLQNEVEDLKAVVNDVHIATVEIMAGMGALEEAGFDLEDLARQIKEAGIASQE